MSWMEWKLLDLILQHGEYTFIILLLCKNNAQKNGCFFCNMEDSKSDTIPYYENV